MCQKCGCNTCDTESTALVLNESKAPATILSEGLKHHIDTNKPLTEHLYRAGSRAYFDLFAEARSLYSRGILEFTHEDDKALLTETNLGHFGMFEGKKVPLDFPIELNEEMDLEKDEMLDLVSHRLFNKDYKQLDGEERDKAEKEAKMHNLIKEVVKEAMVDYDFSKEELIRVIKQLKRGASTEIEMIKAFEKTLGRELTDDEIRGFKLNEAKKKKAKKKDNRPIGKPMRDTSGGKAYKVYVKDPKTKKVKTVRFGSGGLRAKINDSKARAAFAARHKCSTKKDRTKAGYWSCRLPRYAKLLGLKSSFSGFW